MAKPQMGKTGDRIVGNMKLREEYGVIDRDGKLIPFEQARNKVQREASKREMEDHILVPEGMTGTEFSKELSAIVGRVRKNRGRSASRSAEKAR